MGKQLHDGGAQTSHTFCLLEMRFSPSIPPSLRPSSQPALGGAYKSLLPPTGDDTWRTESTASALAVLSHGFPGARWAPMRRRCFSPWGISGCLLLVPVWFLSLLCVKPNLLLCCSTRPSDVYITADNVRMLVCSECLSCLFTLFYIHVL